MARRSAHPTDEIAPPASAVSPSRDAEALAALGAGWWEWNADGRSLVCGETLAALRGVVPANIGELLGQVDAQDRPRLHDALGRVGAEPLRLDYRIGSGAGSRWVQGTLRSVDRPAGRAVLAVEVDIDAPKRGEAALRARGEEAATATRDKERFVYICSHDLREPLRMISGFLGLLERRCAGLDERQHEYLGLALDGARRLDRMLEDLLRYSRCGRTREPAHVPLADALADARSRLRELEATAGADVRIGELPTVWGDPVSLSDLIGELVANACIFRGERPACIAIDAARGAHEWVVTVADEGIGIAPGDRQRAFEVFQRLQLREASAHDGNGVGLAIAAKIVQQHGGRIWIDDGRDGRGTCVRFTLPDA